MARQPNGQSPDAGTRLVLEELRNLRVELRDDRRRADADRQRSDEDRRRSDERFAQMMHEFREDAARREGLYLETTQTMFRMFRDIRSVGLAIVKTLNRHSRLLESINGKLGVRGNGGRGNGRRS